MTNRAVIGLIVAAVLGTVLAYAASVHAANARELAIHLALQDDATAAATTISQAVAAGILPSVTTWSYHDARVGVVTLIASHSASSVQVTASGDQQSVSATVGNP